MPKRCCEGQTQLYYNGQLYDGANQRMWKRSQQERQKITKNWRERCKEKKKKKKTFFEKIEIKRDI